MLLDLQPLLEGETVEGAATLTGNGSLTDTGTVVRHGNTNFAGSGSLAAAGTVRTQSGAGSSGPPPGKPYRPPHRIVRGRVALAATSTLSAFGLKVRAPTVEAVASLTSRSDLDAGAHLIRHAAATLTVPAGLVAVGEALIEPREEEELLLLLTLA